MSICDHELMHHGPFVGGRAQQTTHALNVFSLAAHSADNDAHVRVRYVDAFVEHTSAHEGTEVAAAEGSQCFTAFHAINIR